MEAIYPGDHDKQITSLQQRPMENVEVEQTKTGSQGGPNICPPAQQKGRGNVGRRKARLNPGRKILPRGGPADLSDITGDQQVASTVNISTMVSPGEITEAIRKSPNGRAAGPDGIPNEILKIIAPTIAEDMAQAVTNMLETGAIPETYKESVTATIRKERKADYTLPSSYRPVALENTLAKVTERIVAEKIADAAEGHGLLPWNQFGGRRKRSTLSAIDLLTSCVQTAWNSKRGCVVSMLSLDISGHTTMCDDPASRRSTLQPKLLLISVNHRTDIEFDIACDPFWSSG